jgi:hypothetical protein
MAPDPELRRDARQIALEALALWMIAVHACREHALALALNALPLALLWVALLTHHRHGLGWFSAVACVANLATPDLAAITLCLIQLQCWRADQQLAKIC